MSKDQRKLDKKRKKKLEEKKRKVRQANSLAYVGNKYKSDDLIPTHMHNQLGRIYFMPSDTPSRLKEIDDALGLHEIIASVRQLSYMKQHSTKLLDALNAKLKITYAKAPVGRNAKGQSYELQRTERPDPSVRERLLEKVIWKQWSFQAVRSSDTSFVPGVCQFIQSYQVPLQGTWDDTGWGKIDLVGVTPKLSPVVIELKQEGALDTPLRMLVEALAYACAVRKAWSEGGLRQEWVAAMEKHELLQELPETLSEVPVILIAPSEFWTAKIGKPKVRTKGRVRDDAWPPFMELVRQFGSHGYPVHFVQFEIVDGDEEDVTIADISTARLPSD